LAIPIHLIAWSRLRISLEKAYMSSYSIIPL
jgi:hypothetical protein